MASLYNFDKAYDNKIYDNKIYDDKIYDDNKIHNDKNIYIIYMLKMEKKY